MYEKAQKLELVDQATWFFAPLNESVLHLRRITTRNGRNIPISTVLVRIEGDTYTRAFVLLKATHAKATFKEDGRVAQSKNNVNVERQAIITFPSLSNT